MRNSARRLDYTVFLVAWLFAIVGAAGQAAAQTRPPIEAAMREVQARHQALLSGAPFYYATSFPPRYWPPCDPEGDGGGPAFPPDGYYDQWFDSGVTDEQRYELAEHVLGCLYKILGEDGDGYGEGEGYLKSTWQDPEGMTQSEWDDQARDHTWSDFVAFSGTDLSGPLYVYNQVDADNFEAVVESVIDYCQAHLTHLPLSATFTDCNVALTDNSEDSCVSPGCAGDTSCGLDHFIAEADVINVIHTQASSCEGVSAWATWTGRPTEDPATWGWSSPINYVNNGGSPTAVAPFAGVTHFYLALEVYEDDILEFPPPPAEPDGMYHYFEKQYSLTSDQEIAGTYVAGDRPHYPWTCDTAPLDEFEDAEDTYVRYGWRSLLPPSVGAPGGVIAVFEPFFGHLDICPSDCADSTDLDPKGEQSDENGEDDDCGSNSQAESEDPVMLSTGEKHERVTDVTVRLRGRDFALSREYTSRGSYRSSSSGNLVGQGWSANVFQFLIPAGAEQADDVLALSGPPMNYVRKFFEVESSDPRTWEPHGPSKQRVEATAIRITHTANPNEPDSIYTVYALKEPGQWTKYYYRLPEEGEGDSYSGYFAVPGENISTDMEGLLLAEVDPTGQNTWVYTYLSLDGAAGMPRLCCIYLNPALSGNAGFPTLDASLSTIGARALARFHWYWGDTDPREGKLARVDIERFVGNTTSTAVEQTAAYTYAEGSTVDADVGDDAMLVQVAHSVQVDAAPLGVDPVWTRYTQYRYHDGATAEGAFDTEGEDGALKLVILPEQIEYYANSRTSTGWDPEEAVAIAAAELLNMADGDEEDGLSPVDLAAKVVGYDTGRVSVQYLQSSCGCGGSAAQGLRQVFTYSGPYDTNGLSTRIQEQTYDGDSWEDYRIRYVDQRRYGTGAVPYKVIEALHDPISGRTWANHYVYDTTGGTRTMLKHYTPSAIASYTPYSASPSTFPSVTLETSGGLAYQYEYNAEKRRTKTYVGTRVGGADDFDLVSETEYEAGVRSDLPATITRYVVAGTSDPDEMEVTTYDYVLSDVDAVLMMSMSVEREFVTENGPGEGVYISHEIFDGWGRNIWSVAPDDSLSCRVYHYDHGGVIVSVANANRSGGSNYGGMPWYGEEADRPRGRFLEGGDLVTLFEYDSLGRMISSTDPGGIVTRMRRELLLETDAATSTEERPTVLHLATVTLPHSLGGGVYNGPATVSWQSAGGNTFRSSAFEVDTLTIVDGEVTAYAFGAELSRSDTRFTHTGLVSESRAWHNVADELVHTTTYEYDELGRPSETTSPTGHITKNAAYDVLGRVLEVQSGTASGLSTVQKMFYDDPDGFSPTDSDQEQGVGNGTLSWVEEYTGEGSEVRRTRFLYDDRDRRVSAKTPLPPYEWVTYDNLDRVTARAVFNGDTNFPTAINAPLADRGMLSETFYSQRGLAYSTRIAIDATDSTPEFLSSHSWFDENGRVIGTLQPNGPHSKRTYDGLGRVVAEYITDRDGDAAPGTTGNYEDVASVSASTGLVRGVELTGDRIVEQSASDFDDSGNLTLSTRTQRIHSISDSITGALDEESGVSTYVGYIYDAADRMVATVNYGVNTGGTIFEAGGDEPTVPDTLPGSAPSGSLMSVVEYNSRGLTHRAYDTAGKATEYRYDDLGRRIAVIENAQEDPDDVELEWYIPGSPSTTNPARWRVTAGLDKDNVDWNRVTSTVYDGDGNVTFYIAHTPDPSDSSEDVQITAYVYGTSAGSSANVMDSLTHSGALLHKVHYPDESTGFPNTSSAYTVEYAYNRLGELRGTKDQNGTVHAYTRDAMGRLTSDAVTTFGSNIDQTVKRVIVAFDDFGRLGSVKSMTHVSDTSSTYVRNEVGFDYTSLWQTAALHQTQSGALPSPITSTFPSVEFGYDTSDTDNRSRLSTVTYPLDAEASSGAPHTLEYHYGTTDSLSDLISRVAAIDRLDEVQGGSMDPFLAYTYVGLGMHATAEYLEPDVLLDRTYSNDGKHRSSGATSQAEGYYPGWDNFGRVARHAWVRGDTDDNTSTAYPTKAPLMEQVYGYDSASNRISMDDVRPGSKDSARSERYTYDGLDRLLEAQRGRLNSTPTWLPWKGGQLWDLDMLGNWRSQDTDLATFGTYGDAGDKAETRLHNQANEITRLDPNPDSPLSYKPFTNDDAGNLRFIPFTVNDAAAGDRYTYDAWNRLVLIESVPSGGVTGSGAEVVRYDYNALHWRTRRLIARDYPGPPEYSGIEECRYYYSPSWQLIEERVDEDAGGTFTPTQWSQLFWGPRYIDDAAARRVTSDLGEDWQRGYYHITNVQFSTETLISDARELIERVRYEAYGKARHLPPLDMDLNGSFSINDRNLGLEHIAGSAIGDSNAWPGTNYNVLMDLDFSGVIEQDEYDAYQNDPYEAALDAGAISNPDFDTGPWSCAGYDGYIYDNIADLSCVRFRWYHAALGRWMTRDPAGYVDGVSLLSYCSEAPLGRTDILGLSDYHLGVEPPINPSIAHSLRASWSARGIGSGESWLTIANIEDRARLNVDGGYLLGMPNASRHFSHFLYGGGTALEVRFERLCSEDPAGHGHLLRELNDAMQWAEQLAIDGDTIHMVVIADASEEASSRDWLYAVGKYYTWARASVTRCGDQFTMEWEFHMRDVYDWELGSKKKGGLVTDGEMALLHRSTASRAEEYYMHGVLYRSETWTLGERYIISGSDLESPDDNGRRDARRSSDRDRRPELPH